MLAPPLPSPSQNLRTKERHMSSCGLLKAVGDDGDDDDDEDETC